MSNRDHIGRDPSVEEWERLGRRRVLAGFEVFSIELDPIVELNEPLLVLHGFPTCSYDYRNVAAELATDRRLLLLDFVGFGLSAKPDVRYSLEMHADVVVEYVASLGIKSVAMLTHDMGDSVGGELLARNMGGSWPVDVTTRVLTNGSIYLDLAKLTDGQKLLLALPDEELQDGPDEAALSASLAATMAPGKETARGDLLGDASLIVRGGGNRLLPRTIRYIEDRKRAEGRYTGAIEEHSSPLGVLWGAEDPIAVKEMAARLARKRPDARVSMLEGVGHYPMLEGPSQFTRLANELLASCRPPR